MRPVIEKRKFELRHIVYIFIIIISLIAVGVAVYMQFFKDEELGLIFGITKEDDADYKKLKENFLNIFDNTLNVNEAYSGTIKKIKEDSDIIVVAFNTQEQKDNYTVDIKIPYFNIDSEFARQQNKQIKEIFKDKSENVLSSNSKTNIIYNVKYKAYEQNDILSLVILSELKEGDSSERIIIQTYNYNLKTNKEVTIDDIIKQKNIDENTANSKIKDEINQAQEQNIKLNELGYNVNIRDANSDTYKIKNAKEFFIGQDGYVYIIYPYGNDEFTSEMDIVIFR